MLGSTLVGAHFTHVVIKIKKKTVIMISPIPSQWTNMLDKTKHMIDVYDNLYIFLDIYDMQTISILYED